MKKLIILVIIAVMMITATSTAGAKTSDKELAKAWARDNCKGAKIEKVVTISKGGYKGKAGRWSVRYPKKVKKGKKVTVYMVTKGGDVKAMVCLGIVKGDKAKKVKSKVTNKAKCEPNPPQTEEIPPVEMCEHCAGPGECVYWVSNEHRHMTPEEIEEFEFLESHYQNEAGEWVER